MSPRKRTPGRRTITVSSRAWRALHNVAREPEILAEFGTKTITATLQAVIDKVVLEEVPVLRRIVRQRVHLRSRASTELMTAFCLITMDGSGSIAAASTAAYSSPTAAPTSSP